MYDVQILWDLEDDAEGNVQHLAANDVSVEEFVEVFANNYDSATISRESGRPIIFGWTSTGRHLAVVWEEVQAEDPLIIRPVTAYETPPRRRKRR